MKTARIFLGRELPLPSAVASRLLENNRNSNDLSGILLVLPGQAARRSVQQELLKSCPKGLLLPQLLSPHSLLHYSRQEVRLPDQLATALLWGAAISEAEAAPEEFDLVFPDGKFPGNPYTGSKPLVKLRHELVAGGKSIHDAAALLGERGYQLARLEKIFCAGLEAHGYTDPFVNDRAAVDDNAAFADVKKVIIAAIPDLPSVIKDKLAAIAEKYPGKVEIWIYAAEKDQDEYDEAGVPIPEKWENKSFLCNDIFSAADPLDGAKRAIRLTSEPDAETGKDIFDPEKCAVVLADPAMYGVFADEFKKLKTVDGKDLQIIDPSGVPVSVLRIFRLLTALKESLSFPDDFTAAADLLRQADFLRAVAGSDEQCGETLKALDDFQLKFFPDNLQDAILLADGTLKSAFQQIIFLQKKFDSTAPAVFLREFLTGITSHISGDEEARGVPFVLECDFFNEQLTMLEDLSASLIRKAGNLTVLSIFLDNCGQQNITPVIPPGAISFEGCLEMPFLTQQKIIFCGMNEGFFPDRIDLTPFLTDKLRRKLNIRSNRETLTRALCHLEGVQASKKLQVIVLRRNTEKDALRPSSILFNGDSLPDRKLLERCKNLFSDPDQLPEPEIPNGDHSFFLCPQLSYLRIDGKMRLSPTELDIYLKSPFDFYWEKVLGTNQRDYNLNEPDAAMTGTLLHKVFELTIEAEQQHCPDIKAVLLSNLDKVLHEKYGKKLPVLIQIFADNVRQRLEHAAGLLEKEAADGFEPIAAEYKIGGEKGYVEFHDVCFRGKIDRIEYNKEKGILRLVDIKTGKDASISRSHISVRAPYKIYKFQLPLYVMLLKRDQNFFEKFPETADFKHIECAYIHLPQAVTDINTDVWDAADLESKLPLFENRLLTVIGEIRDFEKNVIYSKPSAALAPKFFSDNRYSLLLPDARQALPGITWKELAENPAASDTAAANSAGNKTAAAAGGSDAPEITILEPKKLDNTGKPRCCQCPLAGTGVCGCCNGDCSTCETFNGFKRLQVIAASAGTGKTYSLASRFVQLLDYGASPESILAITFTRKASGEIFDKLVNRFCDLITDSGKPANHCRRLAPANFTALLKNLLSPGKETLQISTIDSFFMRLLNSFAPELGVWGDIKITDDQDPGLFRQILRQWINSLSPADRDTLRELLKTADPDNSSGFYASLLKLLSDVHEFYLSFLLKTTGGHYPQLEYSPWQFDEKTEGDENQAAEAAEELRRFAEIIAAPDFRGGGDVEADNIGRSRDAIVKRLNALADLVESIIRGQFTGKIPEQVTKLLENFNKVIPADRELLEMDSLPYTGKIKFRGELAENIRTALKFVRIAVYRAIRRKNQAVFSLIAEFDRIYNEKIRKNGILNCRDLPAMLCSLDDESREIIFGNGDGSMEFRMDARIDHFLFDEFQDTSDIQYMVFDPLLKELFSGESERFRSFFCVGDIKQSIYQWRGGDPALFDYVKKQLPDQAADSLVKSYRSSAVILNTVNTVFGKNAPEDQFKSFNQALKKMNYELHRSAKDLAGNAELHVIKEKDAAVNIIINYLRENNALNRGFTVGVLVQDNSTARRIGDRLQQLAPDLPYSIDGTITPADSMTFNVFKELLTLAAHPGDSEAANFLKLTSFGINEAGKNCGTPLTGKDWLELLGLPENMPLDAAIRKELHLNGLGNFAKRFASAIADKCGAFDRKRLNILCRTAEKFSGTPMEFIEQIKFLGETGNSLDNTIQIMTYHKSKGLEFDIVFMPDIANHNGNHPTLIPEYSRVDYGDYKYGEPMRHPEWVSYLPQKDTAALIPPFREQRQDSEIEKVFAKICTLYVAMTRARHALCMMIPDKNSESAAFSPDCLLRQQLDGYHRRISPADQSEVIFSYGSRTWIDTEEIRRKLNDSSSKKVKKVIEWNGIPDVRLTGRKVSTASGEKTAHFTQPAAMRFAADSGKNVGTQVHELFEKITFIDKDFDEKSFCAGSSAEAAGIFTSAMAADSPIRTLLTAVPGEDAEVWCEKRFIRFDEASGAVIPGAFDRVVIYRTNGNIDRAEIIDYKSDRLKTAGEFAIYAPQLKSYRASLSALLDIPEEKIICRICALRLREIITVN